MKSKCNLFSTGHHHIVEERIINHINSQPNWFSQPIIGSTRAVGDGLQSIVSDAFEQIIGPKHCKSCSKDLSRKNIADVAFEDYEDRYYAVDVKTHRKSTKFNMPNLISVRRLSKFYEESDNHYFVVLMISYDTSGLNVLIQDVKFIPIEYLGWDCLTIGALGWGQIQITNSNNITVNEGYDRTRWMLELCNKMLSFYPKEIDKIEKRIKHFERSNAHWLAKRAP